MGNYHTSEALSNYLESASRYPHVEDKVATKKELVTGNLKLVVYIAKEYSHHTEQLRDHIQDGNEGLMVAAEKYDSNKGPFVPYAVWYIRAKIIASTIRMRHLVRAPKKAARNYAVIKARLDSGMSIKEVAEEVGLYVEAIETLCQRYEDLEWGYLEAGNDAAYYISKCQDLLANAGLNEGQLFAVEGRLQGYSLEEMAKERGVTRQAIHGRYTEALVILKDLYNRGENQ